MSYLVKVPDLGEGIAKVEIVAWHISEGEVVDLEQDIVEVVTDKAVFNVPAPVRGTVRRILAAKGSEVSVGEVIAEIE